MEIKLNSELNAVTRAGGLPQKAAKGTVPGAAAAFAAAEALNQALTATDDVRLDEVARARSLVANEHYPPAVMVQKIARLLALQWDQSE